MKFIRNTSGQNQVLLMNNNWSNYSLNQVRHISTNDETGAVLWKIIFFTVWKNSVFNKHYPVSSFVHMWRIRNLNKILINFIFDCNSLLVRSITSKVAYPENVLNIQPYLSTWYRRVIGGKDGTKFTNTSLLIIERLEVESTLQQP